MISGLTFGCARLRPDKRSDDILRECYDLGIRSYDTASSYGTELILGRYFQGQTDIEFSTKVGLTIGDPVALDNSFYYRFGKPLLAQAPYIKRLLFKFKFGFRPEENTGGLVQQKERVQLGADHIKRSVEQSLLWLQRDSIDILLLHDPNGLVIDDRLSRTLVDLRSQGLIKEFGEGYGEKCQGCPQLPESDWIYCKYGSDLPKSSQLKVKLHGVLRATGLKGLSVISNYRPNAGIIFSASSPAQVREVVQCWKISDTNPN